MYPSHLKDIQDIEITKNYNALFELSHKTIF